VRWLRWLWLLFCLLMAGGLWGLTPSLAKVAASEGAHPFGLTLWQGVGGGLALLALSLARGRRIELSRAHLSFYLLCGLAGTVVPTCLLFVTSRHLSAGVLAMIITMVPIITYGLALVARVDVLSVARAAGIALGLLAVGLLIVPREGLEADSTPLWILAALVIPTAYAVEGLIIALRRPPVSDEISLVAGMLLAGAAVLAPVVLATGTEVALAPPWDVVDGAIVGMIVVNVVSYVFFVYLVKISGPVFASQAGYWAMIAGVLWGMALFGERHSAWVWTAFALLLAAMTLVKERAVARR